jgi:hypothetical protein
LYLCRIYVEVRYWNTQADADAGLTPKYQNNFLMELTPERTQPVSCTTPSGARGWLRADGVCIPKDDIVGDETWQMETVTIDLRRKIHEHIRDYWERAEAKGYPADHRSRSIRRDRNDPKRVLERQEVRTLEGARFERTSRTQQPRDRTGRTHPR